eukprot:3478498-Ditylum_brightwellii.AAC.1
MALVPIPVPTVSPKGIHRAVTPEPELHPQCNMPPKIPPFFIPMPKGFRNIYEQQEHVPQVIPHKYSANFAVTHYLNELQGKHIKATTVLANGIMDEKRGKIMEYHQLIQSDQKAV